MRRGTILRIERHAQGGVEHDAQERAAAAKAAAIGEHGIVGEDGVDAGHGGVGLPAQGLNGGARGFAGDPVGLARGVMAGRRCDAPVERHGDFHQHEGTLVLDPASEAFVEAAGFGFADADGDLDARGAQCFHAVAGDGGVGVDGGGDDAGESGGDERFSAGRRAAGVIAGFERDVGGAAVEAIARVLFGFVERDDFGVVERSYSCQPSPTTWPARSRMTQPTAGLGEVTPMPRRARSRARCIQ